MSMRLLARLRAGLAIRDRGDSPVPSAVIIAGLAVIAVALLVWISSTVGNFMDQAPTDLPAGPGSE